MRDIYQRLRPLGFTADYLKAAVLPDWWDDDLAEVPANRAIAESAIARQLGIEIAQLRDPERPLSLPDAADLRFKHHPSTRDDDLIAAATIARRVARVIALNLEGLPAFAGKVPAVDLRRDILARDRTVTLQGLLRWCWEHGIIVADIDPGALPGRRGFDGLAAFIEQRPAIILASRRDGPPWLAFHLAHELGHLMCGHVHSKAPALVDAAIDAVDASDEERQADVYGLSLLTGEASPEFPLPRPLTVATLSELGQRLGPQRGIDPGTIALLCGRAAQRWAAAQGALKLLGCDRGGHVQIGSALNAHVTFQTACESSRRLLTHLLPHAFVAEEAPT